MKISFKPKDGEPVYLPRMGVRQYGVREHKDGTLLRIEHVITTLKEIAYDDANVLENVELLIHYLQNKD